MATYDELIAEQIAKPEAHGGLSVELACATELVAACTATARQMDPALGARDLIASAIGNSVNRVLVAAARPLVDGGDVSAGQYGEIFANAVGQTLGQHARNFAPHQRDAFVAALITGLAANGVLLLPVTVGGDAPGSTPTAH